MYAKYSRGYIYLVSRSGVTGAGNKAGHPIAHVVKFLGDHNAVPTLLGFGISTGLYYSFLTGNVSVPSLSFLSGDMTEHALNIPVKAGFSVPVGSGLSGFLNFGPTFVCGLASSIKPLGVDLLKTDNYKHEYLNRFDIMVGANIGAVVNNMFRISAGYDFGCLDQFGAGIKGKNDDGSTKDRGYSLNRSRIKVGVALLF